MAHWWNDHDLLVTPTLGAPQPELGWFTAAGPQQEKERNISFIRYTAPFNMTGQPAISLPLHWTPPACRSACSWRPPMAGRTCSSGSPASSSKPRPGTTGTRGYTRNTPVGRSYPGTDR